jgi:hypothetical protein
MMVKVSIAVIGTTPEDAQAAAGVREVLTRAASSAGLVGSLTHREEAKEPVRFTGTYKLPGPASDED